MIPNTLYYRLRSSARSTPLLYGLLKIHKPEVPLQPIASFYTSPTYQLSKHLVHLLSPLVGNTSSHIKNSKDFAAFISDQTIPEDKILVSFDDISLFTNYISVSMLHIFVSEGPSINRHLAQQWDPLFQLP